MSALEAARNPQATVPAAPDEQPALAVRGVTKYYDGFALHDLNLELAHGSVMGLIGPNGAGKTTLLRLILSLVEKDAGSITVLGRDPIRHERELKNRIGFVAEESYLPGGRKVQWAAGLAGRMYTNWDQVRFRELLHGFGIGMKQKIGNLSRGARVKLSLALALSHGAELFLLDEPTQGLDPLARREVLDLLARLVREEGKSALVSSHIMDDLQRVADEVVILHEGRILLDDGLDELRRKWKRLHYQAGALADEIERTLVQLADRPFGREAVTADFPAIEGDLTAAVAAGEVKVEAATLDDILICLTRRAPESERRVS